MRRRAAYTRKSLDIKRDLGDKVGIGSSLNGLGNVAYALGDLDAADAYYTQIWPSSASWAMPR